MAVEGAADETGFTLELVERLRPYMGESLIVLNRDWSIRANLAPPRGLIGQGLGVGLHTLEHMHPDDAVQIMELGAQAFDTEPGWTGTMVVRMRKGDNTYAPYEVTAFNLFDDPLVAGLVIRTREVIHEPIENLGGLTPSSAIESVAELLPIGMFLLDAYGRIVFVNRIAQSYFDLTEDELKRTDFPSLIESDDRDELNETLEGLLHASGRSECTVRLATTPSTLAHCCFSSEGSTHVTRIVVTLEDVTDSHAARLDLEHRASHDPLTGLKNRDSIFQVVQSHLDCHDPVTVAYVDLDGFKAINDTWGHDQGDQFLIALAHALLNAFDSTMEIGRIGGDEFVLVWGEGFDPAMVTNQVHAVIAGIDHPDDCAVSASVGTAHASPDDTARELIRRADHAMYTVKSSRTRRVDLVGDDPNNR